MTLYPVNLDIRNKKCVIVGGGYVALRKIGSLLSCGGNVVVISPEATDEIEALAASGKIEYIPRGYEEGDLQGAFLAFAATDNRTVQQAVADEAERSNILINSADDPEVCSFQVPASIRRGDFLLTISTGGSSPALSAKLRRQLEDEYGLEYERLVSLLARIREKIVADGNTSKSHKKLFQKLLEVNILHLIQTEDWTKLQDELAAILPQDLDIAELIESVVLAQTEATSPGGNKLANRKKTGRVKNDI